MKSGGAAPATGGAAGQSRPSAGSAVSDSSEDRARLPLLAQIRKPARRINEPALLEERR